MPEKDARESAKPRRAAPAPQPAPEPEPDTAVRRGGHINRDDGNGWVPEE